jgi:DNA-nicking Smr family endonuclease
LAEDSSVEHKDRDDDEDLRLFRQTVGEVKPLVHDLADIDTPRPAPVPAQRHRDEREVLREMANGLYDGAEIETGDELLYIRTGIQHSVARKLRRGQLAIEAELDLHGYTVDAARELLFDFIHRAQMAGQRCVRIVHGKGNGSRGGQPVLKGKANHWLRQMNAVLAFCSARPVDGGTGALYVLLRRASE